MIVNLLQEKHTAQAVWVHPGYSDEDAQHYGPPPEVGWWQASDARRTDTWRYWNGERWSKRVCFDPGSYPPYSDYGVQLKDLTLAEVKKMAFTRDSNSRDMRWRPKRIDWDAVFAQEGA